MFKTILIFLMGYLFYRVVKGQLTVKKSQSRFENGSEREESLGISEEDIRDAKFTDINEEEN
tara:strand:- start:1844 stop:2029 length:186 start_codon:yes stop_codon:yes gene_type:complete